MTLFSANSGNGPILRVSEGGGAAEPVTALEPAIGHRAPQLLPDGQHLLYTRIGEGFDGGRQLWVNALDGTKGRHILDADAGFFAEGQLLFVRQGTLFSQPFDPTTLTVTGEPVTIASNIASNVGAAVSVSERHEIAYRESGGSQQRQFVWFDRSGRRAGTVGDALPALSNPNLSPDGRYALLQRMVANNVDIWQLDIARGVFTRITTLPGIDALPVWSPEGQRFAFASTRENTGGSDLFVAPISGDGKDELLYRSASIKSPSDWSPDGATLLFRDTGPDGTADIMGLPMNGQHVPFPVVQTASDERDAQFSPDGHWIAFESDQSGRPEIYLQGFPGPGRKWPVSANGGTQARWRPDGKAVFYFGSDGRLNEVPITLPLASDTPEIGAAHALFVAPIRNAGSIARQQYMVAKDGNSFLVNVLDEAAVRPITIVLNWYPQRP
jgi:Tol biopolymer transport system component